MKQAYVLFQYGSLTFSNFKTFFTVDIFLKKCVVCDSRQYLVSGADEFEVDEIAESRDVDEEVAAGAGLDVLAMAACCLAARSWFLSLAVREGFKQNKKKTAKYPLFVDRGGPQKCISKGGGCRRICIKNFFNVIMINFKKVDKSWGGSNKVDKVLNLGTF